MQKKIALGVLLLFLMALLSLSHETSTKIRAAFAYPASKMSLKGWFKENPLLVQVKQLELENQLLYQEIDKLGVRWEESDFLPAKVIYRPISTFATTLWINVGEDDNREKVVIGKSSPVLFGKHVVGIVDTVGKTRSSVRLITDPGVTPSVRCVRGNLEIATLLVDLDRLTEHLVHHPGMETALTRLKEVKTTLLEERGDTVFLAKGELLGASQTSFRKWGTTLKGSGFNYDFADSFGPAKDLRGKVSLLEAGDLLVTTGLDGVFPEGLPVAWVKEVLPLKEGDTYFELIAETSAGSLDQLSHLLVMPPEKNCLR